MNSFQGDSGMTSWLLHRRLQFVLKVDMLFQNQFQKLPVQGLLVQGQWLLYVKFLEYEFLVMVLSFFLKQPVQELRVVQNLASVSLVKIGWLTKVEMVRVSTV